MVFSLRSTFIWAVYVWIISGSCAIVQAADLYAQGILSQRFKYDDNIGLKSSNKVSDLSSHSSIKLNLGIQTDALKIGLKPGFKFTKFAEESELNSNDQRVVGYVRYLTRSSILKLTTSYDRDTTRTKDEDDTGEFILDNVDRQELEIQPSWTYQHTRKDTFTLSGKYNDVSFEERLVDYSRFMAELKWSHNLSSVDELNLQTIITSIKPESLLDKDALIYGIGAGWNSKRMRNLELDLTIGFVQIDLNGESLNKYLPAANLRYKINSQSEIHSVFARTISPSGNGEVLVRDVMDLAFKEQWNSTLSWDLSLRYQTQESLATNGRVDRDFLRLSPSIEWEYNKTWKLRSRYQFRWQQLDNDNDRTATSNAVMFMLIYRSIK